MNEIFLQDYNNNTAQAQDPDGIAAVQAQPGFENYIPSSENQSITPFGLGPTPDTGQIPDLKNVAKNVAIDSAKNYIVKKVGLEGLKGNVLNSVIGASSFTNPIGALYTAGSLLPDGVRGIAEVLRSKRAEKANNRAIQKQSINNLQQQIDAGNYGSQTNQDIHAGAAPTPTSTSTQARHTTGPAGLHSGY